MNRFTRRDLLATFLAWPAVSWAGCAPQDLLLPAGGFVGPDVELGHRLRDAAIPRASHVNDRHDASVVIVGAGIAGLAAGWRLLRQGITDFVILELESHAGGTSHSGQSPVSSFPWGAHYIPVPPESFTAARLILDEMGLLDHEIAVAGQPVPVAEQYLCRDPQERIFFRGNWFEGLYLQSGASPDDIQQYQRFEAEISRWVTYRDNAGRRAFDVPMAACSTADEVLALDRQTFADWMGARGFTSPRLIWYVDYACRDDYGLRYTETSAWAGLYYFAARVRSAGDDAEPLITVPEGNGQFVQHFAKQLAKQLQRGQAVVEVRTDMPPGQPVPASIAGSSTESAATPKSAAAKSTTQIVVSYNPVTGLQTRWHTRQVVFAAPQFLAPYLISGYRSARGSAVADFDYGPWMVANLHLINRPVNHGFSPAWDNVIYESPALGYVSATHQRGIDHGQTVWTYYYPMCDGTGAAERARILSLGWNEWAEIILSDLGRAHRDLRQLVSRIDVMRWGHAMIRPRCGFISGRSRKAAAEPFGGIHFAHSDLSGLALFEEALHHGVRAAEEVLRDRGVEFGSLLSRGVT